MRDFDKKPYSTDEARVAEWLARLGVGGGDDPIGFILASHEYRGIQQKFISELIAVQEEYIALLTDWITANAGFLFAHGISTPEEQIKKGEDLRTKMKELKEQIG